MGNRLGSAEVMKAARIRQVQENVMLIRIKVLNDGTLERRAQTLRELMERTNYRPMSIQWRPGKKVL